MTALVHCDVCGCFSEPDVAEAMEGLELLSSFGRDGVSADGWRRLPVTAGLFVDYCPSCFKALGAEVGR